MLNPWLSFPLQAIRLGWDAQFMVVDQMMRLAGMRVAEQKPATASAADTAATVATEAPAAPVEAASPESRRKHGQAAQNVAKVHKRRGTSKHRRSK
jgi:hypothetical protein